MFNPGNIPGQILLSRVAGSTAYNLNVGESDLDYQLVYLEKTPRLLGLNRPDESVVGASPNDFTAHEVGKFLRLALKGNPTITENLISDIGPQDYCNELFQSLRNGVDRIISANTIRSYLGYAYGQMHKMQIKDNGLHSKGGKYNEKYGMHLIRLLHNAVQLATLGTATVRWPIGSEIHKELMAIRNGLSTKQDVEDRAEQLTQLIDSSKPWKLREEPDYEWVNEWLVKQRLGLGMFI